MILPTSKVERLSINTRHHPLTSQHLPQQIEAHPALLKTIILHKIPSLANFGQRLRTCDLPGPFSASSGFFGLVLFSVTKSVSRTIQQLLGIPSAGGSVLSQGVCPCICGCGKIHFTLRKIYREVAVSSRIPTALPAITIAARGPALSDFLTIYGHTSTIYVNQRP
jgi:hypothetical protein